MHSPPAKGRMGGGGENRESSIPHKLSRRGKKPQQMTSCSGGETPTGEEGQLGVPLIRLCFTLPHPCPHPLYFFLSPIPLLSPLLCLPHLSLPQSPSLSRAPLLFPPTWRKRRRKRGWGWGVSLRPDPGQFPFRSHLCQSRGGGDWQTRLAALWAWGPHGRPGRSSGPCCSWAGGQEGS